MNERIIMCYARSGPKNELKIHKQFPVNINVLVYIYCSYHLDLPIIILVSCLSPLPYLDHSLARPRLGSYVRNQDHYGHLSSLDSIL